MSASLATLKLSRPAFILYMSLVNGVAAFIASVLPILFPGNMLVPPVLGFVVFVANALLLFLMTNAAIPPAAAPVMFVSTGGQDLISVGGSYTRKALRRVTLFTGVEAVVLTVWFYLLSVNPLLAFIELFGGLYAEHHLAGKLEHKPTV